MLLLVLVTICLLLISGATLLIALAHARRARLDLDRRIALVASPAERKAIYRAGAAHLQKTPWWAELDEPVQRFFAFGIANRWGMHMGAAVLVSVAIGSGGLAWMLCHTILRMSLIVCLAAVAAAFMFIPQTLLRWQQTNAEQQFVDLLPTALDMMIRMLRAGLSVNSAVRTIGAETPPPISGIFSDLADLGELGIPLDEALASAEERIGLPDFGFFAVAIALQRSTGGNLAASLEILSEIIRRRHAIRLKAKAATGEVRMSAYILVAIPFFVIAALLVVSPNYLAPLIYDPRGNIILVVAAGSMLCGILTIRLMMRRAATS
jgi:tight adherence protein B